MKHCHEWDQIITGALAEFPKNNTPEPRHIAGIAYGCKCGRWEFRDNAAILPRFEVIPPADIVFKEKPE